MKLLRTVGLRLLQAIPGILGVLVITFIIARVVPNDPARLYVGPQAPEAAAEAVREQWGLNDPIWVQFWSYLTGLFRGDLGQAWHTSHSVAEDMATRLPASIELTLAALLIGLLIAVPLAIAAAIWRDTWVDHISRAIMLLGVSVPIFWVGLLIIQFFYADLGIAPAPVGRISNSINPPTQITGLYVVDSILTGDSIALFDSLSHLFWPALCLSTGVIAVVGRMLRASLVAELDKDYIRTARATGLSTRAVVFKHALGNALAPALTVLGLQIGALLGGAVVVEKVFSWPGIGSYVTDSILNSDFAPVQAYALIAGLLFAVINLVVDLLYVVLTPRMRNA